MSNDAASPPASPAPEPNTPEPGEATRTHVLLLVSTLLIAVCGLVYELLAGTVSSYLLGDSVYQFSIVIGLFMAAMGIGSYLSRYISERLTDAFIWTQLAIGLLGGSSSIILFFAFSHLDNYEPFLVLLSVSIGILIGIEIPLVIRLLRDFEILKLNVSNVLTADYIGALFASLLFPLVLVPQLGLIQTGLFFGLLNVLVAALGLYAFGPRVQARVAAWLATAAIAIVLTLAFVQSSQVSAAINARLYSGEIVHTETTPYQQLVLTRHRGIVSLFINGALQFNEIDEYRYHESLVHPAMSFAHPRKNVLILGGGDGLAVREVLKYSDVEKITLVDIDPAVTRLFRTNPLLTKLNEDSLNDPKVVVVNDDASKFLERTREFFDVAILDLPDPHDVGISRLYTKWFYGLLRARIATHGIVVTQATSPLYAREAFWSIGETLSAAPPPGGIGPAWQIRPYHAYVPTFGEWGFILAAARPLDLKDVKLTVPTRFLVESQIPSLGNFPLDMAEVDTDVNTLESHALPVYYERGWTKWYR